MSLNFYVPISVGTGRNQKYIVLVRDYIGEEPSDQPDEEYVDTAIAKLDDHTIYSFVASTEIDNARIHAPGYASFGITQFLIENNRLDLRADTLCVYILKMIDETTLYVVVDPSSDSDLPSIKCFYSYGKQQPPEIREYPLRDAIHITMDLQLMEVPRVAIITEDEIRARRQKDSKRTIMTATMFFVAGFCCAMGYGFVNKTINQISIEKQNEILRGIQFQEARLHSLRKTKRTSVKDSIPDILSITELYLVDPDIKTLDTGSSQLSSFQSSEFTLVTSEWMPENMNSVLSWIGSQTYLPDGRVVITFSSGSRSEEDVRHVAYQ